MHFSKTYSQLLLTLPQELQENAIEYRQLKKLINKVVLELTSLGLSPAVLHGLLHSYDQESPSNEKGKQRAFGERPEDIVAFDEQETASQLQSGDGRHGQPPTKAVYEFLQDGEVIEPRLRLWVAVTSGASDETKLESAELENETDDSRVAIFLNRSDSPSSPVSDTPNEDLLLVSKPVTQKGQSLVWNLQKKPHPNLSNEGDGAWDSLANSNDSDDSLPLSVHPVELVRKQAQTPVKGARELVIPLASDTAFFQLLHGALLSLSVHLDTMKARFIQDLEQLASNISNTARPLSSISRSFHPASPSSDPSSISSGLLISPFSTSFIPGGKGTKSDLYAWREIFQLYVESEVFESLSERNRGERDLVETERRLVLFAERVTGMGLSDSRKLNLKESQDALEQFLQLNVLILNLKKFQFANAEAARKILKKHAKRTALPIPSTISRVEIPAALLSGFADCPNTLALVSNQALALSHRNNASNMLSLLPATTSSLPHLLVQAIGEMLLPIIPHIDDYSCLICTSIAFKPIRLACGHLFCVRCLVKMQKRGQDHCPCCRALTVLKADKSNIDWALLNFMQDWFPQESSIKLKQNEREATQEELEEMGIVDQKCVVM